MGWKYRDLGFQMSSHQELTRGLSILQWACPIEEKCCVGIFCLLQKILDRLHSSFGFTIALRISRRACGVSEAKISGKVAELPTGKLGSIVGYYDIRDAMNRKDALQFHNEVAAGLVIKAA